MEKPFVGVARSFRQAQVQYESMEEVLEQIGSELGVGPEGIIPMIRSLPKAREVDVLRARIVGLINESTTTMVFRPRWRTGTGDWKRQRHAQQQRRHVQRQ